MWLSLGVVGNTVYICVYAAMALIFGLFDVVNDAEKEEESAR